MFWSKGVEVVASQYLPCLPLLALEWTLENTYSSVESTLKKTTVVNYTLG